MIALSTLAVVVAAAAVGFGALLGGKSKSSATTQSPASTTQSPESNKKQSPVSKWTAANKAKTERLAKAMKAAEAADVAGPNIRSLRSACQDLGHASRAAGDGLPAPNAALTDALRVAFDDFERAVQECMTGVDRGDPAALGRFKSDFEAGQKQLGAAAYIVSGVNKAG